MDQKERLLDELADALFDAGDPDVGRIDQALAELDRADPLPPGRSPEEALAEFKARFTPQPNGDPELTPSYHGEKCLGNGEHPGIPCCCDECNYYLICFPDWRELSR